VKGETEKSLLSIVDCRLSIVDCPLSIVDCRLSIVDLALSLRLCVKQQF